MSLEDRQLQARRDSDTEADFLDRNEDSMKKQSGNEDVLGLSHPASDKKSLQQQQQQQQRNADKTPDSSSEPIISQLTNNKNSRSSGSEQVLQKINFCDVTRTIQEKSS